MTSKRALSSASLPLAFANLISSNGNSSPVVIVSLPIRAAQAQSNRSNSNAAECKIYRLLDPEYQEPFVSLAAIFRANSMTPLQGMERFKLKKPIYDSNLSFAPFPELWVPLKLAQSISEELGRAQELEGFFEAISAYSLLDKETGDLVHNWKISSSLIPAEQYCLEKMTIPFSRMQLLSGDHQIRTPITPSKSVKKSNTFPTSFESIWTKLLELTIFEYEYHLAFLELSDSDSDSTVIISPPTSPRINKQDVFLPNLFTIVLSLLSNENLIDSESLETPIGSSYKIGEDLVVERTDLKSVEGIRKGKLGLLDALALLLMNGWNRSVEGEIKARETRILQNNLEEKVKYEELISRISSLEAAPTLAATSPALAKLEVDVSLLYREVISLRNEIKAVDESVLINYRLPSSSRSKKSSREGWIGIMGWKEIAMGVMALIIAIQWSILSQ